MKAIETGLLKPVQEEAAVGQGDASHPGLGRGLAALTQLSQTCPTPSHNSKVEFKFQAKAAWYHW